MALTPGELQFRRLCEIFRPRSGSTPQIRRPQVIQLVCSILSPNLRGIQIHPSAKCPVSHTVGPGIGLPSCTLARFPSSYCDVRFNGVQGHIGSGLRSALFS